MSAMDIVTSLVKWFIDDTRQEYERAFTKSLVKLGTAVGLALCLIVAELVYHVWAHHLLYALPILLIPIIFMDAVDLVHLGVVMFMVVHRLVPVVAVCLTLDPLGSPHPFGTIVKLMLVLLQCYAFQNQSIFLLRPNIRIGTELVCHAMLLIMDWSTGRQLAFGRRILLVGCRLYVEYLLRDTVSWLALLSWSVKRLNTHWQHVLDWWNRKTTLYDLAHALIRGLTTLNKVKNVVPDEWQVVMCVYTSIVIRLFLATMYLYSIILGGIDLCEIGTVGYENKIPYYHLGGSIVSASSEIGIVGYENKIPYYHLGVSILSASVLIITSYLDYTSSINRMGTLSGKLGYIIPIAGSLFLSVPTTVDPPSISKSCAPKSYKPKPDKTNNGIPKVASDTKMDEKDNKEPNDIPQVSSDTKMDVKDNKEPSDLPQVSRDTMNLTDKDIVVAIAGKVSVGKSSLMRAIVHYLTGQDDTTIQIDYEGGTTTVPNMRRVHSNLVLIDLPGLHQCSVSNDFRVLLDKHLKRADMFVFMISCDAISDVEGRMWNILRSIVQDEQSILVVRRVPLVQPDKLFHMDTNPVCEPGNAKKILANTSKYLCGQSTLVELVDVSAFSPDFDLKPNVKIRREHSANTHGKLVFDRIMGNVNAKKQELHKRVLSRLTQLIPDAPSTLFGLDPLGSIRGWYNYHSIIRRFLLQFHAGETTIRTGNTFHTDCLQFPLVFAKSDDGVHAKWVLCKSNRSSFTDWWFRTDTYRVSAQYILAHLNNDTNVIFNEPTHFTVAAPKNQPQPEYGDGRLDECNEWCTTMFTEEVKIRCVAGVIKRGQEIRRLQSLF